MQRKIRKHTLLVIIFAVYTIVLACYHIFYMHGTLEDVLPILIVMAAVLICLWLLMNRREDLREMHKLEEEMGESQDDDDIHAEKLPPSKSDD